MIDLRPIAEDVVASRPDWSLGAVLTVLAGQRERGSAEDMRRAALAAAADSDGARTPAAIAFNRYWSTSTAKAAEVEKFTGPLAECAGCGQPFPRNTTAAHCPACGAVVRLIEHRNRPPSELRPMTCAGCGNTQITGFDHCARCGQSMPDPTMPAPMRPVPLLPADDPRRDPLPDPVPIGAVINDEGLDW